MSECFKGLDLTVVRLVVGRELSLKSNRVP